MIAANCCDRAEASSHGAVGRYRLHPEIVFKKPVTGAAAEELAVACPEVFSVESGQSVARAARGNEVHLEKARRWRLRSHQTCYFTCIGSPGICRCERVSSVAHHLLPMATVSMHQACHCTGAATCSRRTLGWALGAAQAQGPLCVHSGVSWGPAASSALHARGGRAVQQGGSAAAAPVTMSELAAEGSA